MEGAALVNVWVAPQKLLPKWQMDGIQPCLVLLVDWIIALSHSNKEKTTHIGHFYTLLILIPSSHFQLVLLKGRYARLNAIHLPFWQKFLGCNPQVHQYCSFHEYPILTSYTLL